MTVARAEPSRDAISAGESVPPAARSIMRTRNPVSVSACGRSTRTRSSDSSAEVRQTLMTTSLASESTSGNSSSSVRFARAGISGCMARVSRPYLRRVRPIG